MRASSMLGALLLGLSWVSGAAEMVGRVGRRRELGLVVGLRGGRSGLCVEMVRRCCRRVRVARRRREVVLEAGVVAFCVIINSVARERNKISITFVEKYLLVVM